MDVIRANIALGYIREGFDGMIALQNEQEEPLDNDTACLWALVTAYNGPRSSADKSTILEKLEARRRAASSEKDRVNLSLTKAWVNFIMDALRDDRQSHADLD